MKSKIKKTGFTIIELLTVMSIIVILISLLVPSLNAVRRYAKTVTQKGQFHDISKGLELFRNVNDQEFPDSDALDPNGQGYCGAMKLCEAMVGQDGMGFYPGSTFTVGGPSDSSGNRLYNFDLCEETLPADYITEQIASLRSRDENLENENIKASKLASLYSWPIDQSSIAPFETDEDLFPNAVLSDVFLHARLKNCLDRLGEKIGMPVLYYKADPSKLSHDIANPLNPDNIYNYLDNYFLTELGLPWENVQTTDHPLFDDGDPGTEVGQLFYKYTENPRSAATPQPHNKDSYILISAGWDGLYGTRDDVYNFAE